MTSVEETTEDPSGPEPGGYAAARLRLLEEEPLSRAARRGAHTAQSDQWLNGQ
ncbi:hypothetical protein [Streptomyces sp. NPDC127112]|uniref:hypothetical protein n=1 Tax=Streptomyces sp. NPDC127112 TaxID=3345364 RepID=UPI00362AE993